MKKKSKKNLLKNEVDFVRNLTVYLGYNPEDPRRMEMERLCKYDYGSFVDACNRYLLRLKRAIVNRYMSLEKFTLQDAESFGLLLSSDELDEGLRDDISHLLYGADERAKYFD